MRLEYRVGALLGSIVVVVAAWYFFSRETEPEMLVTADQSTAEPLIPTNSPDDPSPSGTPNNAPVRALTSDPAPSPSGPPAREPIQTADIQDPAPVAGGTERPSPTDTARVVRANTGAVLPDIDLTRVAAASPTRSGSTAEPPQTVELELNRRTVANTAVASDTPDPSADRSTPTLLGASRRPTAAAAPAVRSPAPAPRPAQTAPPRPRLTPATAEPGTEYVIRKDDTLAILAELHYGSQVHVPVILKANPQIVNRHRIYVGQTIRLPSPRTVLGPTGGVTAETVRPTPTRPAAAGPADLYRIQRGDTLYGLASRTYGSGTKWRALLELNRDLIQGDGANLKIGQAIRLPARLPENRRATR